MSFDSNALSESVQVEDGVHSGESLGVGLDVSLPVLRLQVLSAGSHHGEALSVLQLSAGLGNVGDNLVENTGQATVGLLQSNN